MNAFLKVTFMALFALALVLMFSCSTGEEKKEDDKYAYCVYSAEHHCLTGPFGSCPNGGSPSNSCPYEGTSAGGSSSVVGSSSSVTESGGDNDITITSGTNGSFIVTYTYRRATTEAEVLAVDNWYSNRDLNFDKNVYLIHENEYDFCREDGTLEIEKGGYIEDIEYSINNKVLTLDVYDGWNSRDTIEFNGTSNTLEGTWTRDASCREDSEGRCDRSLDYIKAVFTPTTVTFTSDICLADEGYQSDYFYLDEDGWTSNAIDCNNFEHSKGNYKIKGKVTFDNAKITYTYIYNDKSCSIYRRITQPTIAEMQQACKNAADNKAEEDYYWDFLSGRYDFEKCAKDNNFPRELWDAEYYGKALSKSLKSKQQKLNPKR